MTTAATVVAANVRPIRPADELRVLATQAAVALADASAEEILRWAADTFGDRLAVTASMQDTVLAHLAGRIRPGIDVLFLDTGYHFDDTLATADAVATAYPVRLRRLLPLQTVAEQDATYSKDLFARDPDLCCALRKVEPLERALSGYEAWATGIRRAESATRTDTPVVSFDERRGRVKIAPLAAWSDAEVDDYIRTQEVLVNPLLSDEMPSIGCAPCTRRIQPGENPRAGRWAGLAKTECGIHR